MLRGEGMFNLNPALFAPFERLPNNEIFRHRGHPKFFPLSVHRLTSVYLQM